MSPLIAEMTDRMISTGARSHDFLFAQVDDSTMTLWIGGSIALVIIVGIGTYVGNLFAKHWRYKSHLSLFLGLCRAHQLTWKERKLLRLAGKKVKVPHLSLLIAELHWIDRAIINKSLVLKRAKLKKLRAQLFNLPVDEDADAGDQNAEAPKANTTV